jgi:hypothetical protein
MLFDKQHHKNGKECQESRNLPHGLNHTNMDAFQTGNFHGEVVE